MGRLISFLTVGCLARTTLISCVTNYSIFDCLLNLVLSPTPILELLLYLFVNRDSA